MQPHAGNIELFARLRMHLRRAGGLHRRLGQHGQESETEARAHFRAVSGERRANVPRRRMLFSSLSPAHAAGSHDEVMESRAQSYLTRLKIACTCRKPSC